MGKTNELKTCTQCGVEKSLADYYTNWDKNAQVRRHRAACKECSREKNRAYMHEYVRSQETKARRRKYLKEYNQRDYVKKVNQEKAREYNLRPEVQEKRKAYRKLPHVIATHKISNKKYLDKPANKAKLDEWRKEYVKRPDVIARRRAREKIKIDTNPVHKLNVRFATAMYKSLRENKMGKRWESLVNYTLSELKGHLQSKFKEGMTWENYGSYWHVDHIKPKSWFNYEHSDDDEFKECWGLDNLQPLEAGINYSKGNRYKS